MPQIVSNITEPFRTLPLSSPIALWLGDCEAILEALPKRPLFDLVVTSPPYLVGKAYERRKSMSLDDFLAWQGRIFAACAARLKPTGSICWQVGTHVTGQKRSSEIVPLDLLLYPRFAATGLTLRNRIIWHFRHGLHCHHRFSGRHETILWYAASGNYHYDLDAVRVPQKYPGKRHFRPGAKHGTYSGHILGKNPSDVWDDIPNVNSNHPEKTGHPCQFPVALVERLVRSLAPVDGLVFDPFAGVASAGVAAVRTGRRFWGCERKRTYLMTGLSRLRKTIDGTVPVRPLEQPIFDPAHAHHDLLHRNDLPVAREA
jgi:adenine-specific DNA-methyltransferase